MLVSYDGISHWEQTRQNLHVHDCCLSVISWCEFHGVRNNQNFQLVRKCGWPFWHVGVLSLFQSNCARPTGKNAPRILYEALLLCSLMTCVVSSGLGLEAAVWLHWDGESQAGQLYSYCRPLCLVHVISRWVFGICMIFSAEYRTRRTWKLLGSNFV